MNSEYLTEATLKTSPSNEQCWAAGTHAAALTGLIIPFGNIIGPLVVWLIKKNELSLVNSEGKEAVNFQITTTILLLILWMLSFGMTLISPAFVVGIFVFALAHYVPLILAGIRAYKVYTGRPFEYPSVFRFIK